MVRNSSSCAKTKFSLSLKTADTKKKEVGDDIDGKNRLCTASSRARLILRGVNQLADAVKVTPRPQGPQRRPRQEIRLADDHQGRP